MKKFTPTEVLHSLFNPEATHCHASFARLRKVCFALLLFCSVWQTANAQNTPFITRWNLATAGSSTTGLTFGVTTTGTVSYTWQTVPAGTSGSGTFTGTTCTITGLPAGATISLSIAPANFQRFNINNGIDKSRLIAIDAWGDVAWTSMNSAFNGCNNLTTATGNPILTGVTDMYSMFSGCTNFNGNITGWNTAAVTDMAYMFAFNNVFNQPIGTWTTSSVTTMEGMFLSTINFNQPIGTWNTTRVTNMYSMFGGAIGFNQNLSNWNTATVTNMVYMFGNTPAFNQNLGAWTLNANVNLASMLNNSGMTCTNYSYTLAGWAAQPSLPTGRTLGASGINYGTDVVAARTTLTTTKGWTISDNGVSTGACISPEIDVVSNGATIADGSTVPSTTNNTDFGLVTVGSTSFRTFFIQNVGFAPLTISSITSSNPKFVIGTAPTSVSSSASATFTVTYTPTVFGTDNATITINNNDSNEAVYDFAVTGVGNVPVGTPVFTAGAPTICVGSGSTYTATASNAISITYSIVGGIGATINASTGVVSNVTGNFTVRATATGASGMTTTADRAVTVTQNVTTPVFTTGATSLCLGGTDTYTVTASNANSLTFSIVGGTGATINASTGAVSNVTGNFTVRATTTGACGAATTADRIVTVTPNVGTPSFVAGAGFLCIGGTSTYKAIATNATSITYSIVGGTGATINASTGAVSNVTGAFTVRATASGTCGANTTADAMIIITPNVGTASFTGGATAICAGTSGTYTATASNSTSVSYSIVGGTGATINASTGVVSNATGDYTVRATATGTCGAATTADRFVMVTPNVGTPTFTAGATSLCIGGTSAYGTTTSNANSVTLSIIGGTGATIDASTGVVSNVTGNFTVRATATGTCGAVTTADRIVTVTQNIGTPSFTTGISLLCVGDTSTYTAIAANSNSITYSILGGTGATVDVSTGAVSNVTGNFTVRATATGTCGTATGDRFIIVLQNVATPMFTAPTTLLCAGATATYTATAANSNSIAYSILNGVGATINANTGVVSGVTGIFTVVATASGACGANKTANQAVTLNTVPSIAYSGISAVYPTSTAVTALNPTNIGGTPTGSTLFAITPALPTGLVFDGATGTISGTPTAATANTTYTVTTQNACGSTSTTIAFAIPDANAVYSGTANCESFTLNNVNGTTWYDIYGVNGIVASIRPNQNLGNLTVTVGDPAGTSTFDNKEFLGRNINFTSTIAPTTNYDMKLYYYDTEFDTYKAAINTPAATIADLNMAWASGGTGCDLALYAASSTSNGTIAKADVAKSEFGMGNNGFTLQFSLDHFTIFVPTVVGIDALPATSLQDKENGLRLYPNPANNAFNIVLENDVFAQNANINVAITDVMGRVISTDSFTGKSTVINTEAFASGVYFVQLSTSSKTLTPVKMVVQH